MHIFPQLRRLERKYADEVMVIGVHSAKFPNEKEKENLYKAVKRCELEHPVINDAEFQVWQEYACRAWPTMMFIDPEGKVIGKHEGELSYEDMDRLVGQMVAEFDERGLLDRKPISIATEAEPETPLSFPGKVLADEAGDRLFIADTNHNRIVVASLEGRVAAVIGSGEEGLADGDLFSAQFNHPREWSWTGISSTWPTPKTMLCARSIWWPVPFPPLPVTATRATVAKATGQGFPRN